MLIELVKFFIYSGVIVLISKYVMVSTLRKLAESLNLKAKTVGSVAGYATSIPELLTIVVSSFNGLISASIFNVISSNVINFVQYILSVVLNKNKKTLKNKAIRIELVLVIITIIIPLTLFYFNIEIKMDIVPIFIILYMLFIYLNSNVHKLYLNMEDKILEEKIEKEKKWERKNKKKIVKYIFYLVLTGVLLFIMGNLLGNTLENLCRYFNISQTIIGILLGFVTSIPELITFFESQRHYRKKNNNEILGVIEATNNLFTSNILNLFVIQSIGIIIYVLKF